MPKNSLKGSGTQSSSKILDIYNLIKSYELKGINIANFAFGTPGFETPKVIREAAIEALRSTRNPFVPIEGLPELRIKVCDYIDRTRGFRPEVDQIIIGSSIRSMLCMVLLAVIKRGSEVIVTDPGNQSFARAAELLGASVKYISLADKNNFKMNLDKLEGVISKKSKILILTTPHNPTGNILTTSEVQKIGEIAERNDVIIISDETLSQIIFKNRHISPAITDRAQERTVIIENFSYTFSMVGWGLGFLLAPKSIIKTIQTVKTEMFQEVPYFIQHAGIEALNQFENLMPEIVNRYKKCKETLITGLNDLPGFKCEKPLGGIYAFPNISGTGRKSLEFTDYLLESAGIAVLPGEVFGKNGKNHIRFSFATSMDTINEGLMRLEEIF